MSLTYPEDRSYHSEHLWAKAEPDGTMLAMLDAGNCCLEIVGNGTWDKMEHGSLDHLAFCTDAVDELLALVKENGYEVTSPAAVSWWNFSMSGSRNQIHPLPGKNP